MTPIEAAAFTIYEMVNMMMPVLYVLAFVFVLSLVVIVHEGGHFFAARLCGVAVTDYSLGFGKELWGRTDKKGTRWKICALPLGGYVKMLGDEDAAGAKSSADKVPENMRHLTFMAQKLWKRAVIIFAGPAMNYVFAVMMLTGIMFFAGVGELAPVIGTVMENSAAEEAGVQAGDRVVSLNGNPVESYPDIQRIVRVTEFGKPLVMEIERSGETLTINVMPRQMEGYDIPLIGVKASEDAFTLRDDIGFGEAFITSVKQVYMMTADTLVYLGQVITNHRSPTEMRGPLGIAEASGDAARGGLLPLLVFIANISVAVGLMNLLPIPLLDGGHLAMYAVEAVRRKPMTEKAQSRLMWVGFSVLMGLVGYTFFLDIPRLVQRIFS